MVLVRSGMRLRSAQAVFIRQKTKQNNSIYLHIKYLPNCQFDTSAICVHWWIYNPNNIDLFNDFRRHKSYLLG